MTIINSLSGNFQVLSRSFSGDSLPKKTEINAPISERKNSESETVETSKGSTEETVVKLNERVKQLNIVESGTNTLSFRQNIQRSLRFQVDDITGGTIISVIDRQTDEIIRKIPSEEMLAFSRRLTELNQQTDSAVGVLFNSDA